MKEPAVLKEVARILARGHLRAMLHQAGKSSLDPGSKNLPKALAESVNQSVHGATTKGKEVHPT